PDQPRIVLLPFIFHPSESLPPMNTAFDLGPTPPLGYVHNPLVRAAELRTDSARLAAMQTDERARAYLIAGELVILRRDGTDVEPLFVLAGASALGSITETVFLGLREGAPRFGLGLSPADAERLQQRGGFMITDLRSIAVQGLAGPNDLPP